mgnify:CR=1 FL=1
MENRKSIGHIAALITIIIWGTTFISTKVLLSSFQPIEILFFRFVMGLVTLIIVYPKRLKGTNTKQELTFAAAGLSGITLYYLLENIALTYTMASNVGVIISIAPFFTAALSYFLSKRADKLSVSFFVGFSIAMSGICLISFSQSKFEINPIGDILAVIAALVWAVYSLLTKKIGGFGFSAILTTRRVFTYGVLFMLPTLLFFDFKWDFARFADTSNMANLIFLGVGASAICFVTWGYAVKYLGAVKTSTYIYMVPVITVTASALILKEQITIQIIIGTILTLAGLLLSELKLVLFQ